MRRNVTPACTHASSWHGAATIILKHAAQLSPLGPRQIAIRGLARGRPAVAETWLWDARNPRRWRPAGIATALPVGSDGHRITQPSSARPETGWSDCPLAQSYPRLHAGTETSIAKVRVASWWGKTTLDGAGAGLLLADQRQRQKTSPWMRRGTCRGPAAPSSRRCRRGRSAAANMDTRFFHPPRAASMGQGEAIYVRKRANLGHGILRDIFGRHRRRRKAAPSAPRSLLSAHPSAARRFRYMGGRDADPSLHQLRWRLRASATGVCP